SLIEIILVNDGSTPENSKLYNELASKYNHVNVYNKKNEGVSVARNFGVKKSSGEYICFIDADDIVTPNFFSEAIGIINNKAADIVIGNIRIDQNRCLCNILENTDFYNINDALKALLAGMSSVKSPNRIKLSGSPCGRIFAKSIVEYLDFDKDVHFYEDQLYNIKAFRNANKISITSSIWYIYNQNDFSAIHSRFTNDQARLLIPFFDKLLELINDNRYEDIRDDLIIYGLDILINSYKYIWGDELKSIEKKSTLKKLNKSKFVKFLQHENIKACNLSRREWIKYIIIKLHIQKLIKFL
ncbi:MAG: glycosyltransferase, partial [Ruminococcus sp.]|nr:glycosyltransferase [Ruminococcus sp.]